MRQVIVVLVVGMLLGCKGGDKGATSTAVIETPMVVSTTVTAPVVEIPTVSVEATETSSPAVASTPAVMPTLAPRPVVTPTLFGAFELARLLDTGVYTSLPSVQLPDWLELNGDRETWFLTRTHEAYIPLANPNGGFFKEHYSDVVVAADDFLGQYPGSDGAIPVLMMLGHVHSYQVGWHWGRLSESLGQEYEQAIELLMQRHPERLPYILNDLIDLGLPINWVQSADLGTENGTALLFTYQFSPPYGESKGQAYAFVKEPNSPWVFTSIPTRYADGWQHNAWVHTIADINADGQIEIVVGATHVYAGGAGLWLHIFAWQDGVWVDRLSWNPLASTTDAYYGQFWLEDLDEDGVQEIVVYYYTGPPGGGNPTTIDIYQWNQVTYTNTLPIEIKICGYHAFAEAERRRALGDLEGAIAWYEEARRRWLAELDTPDSVCMRQGQGIASGKSEIAQSYRVQVSVLNQIAGTSSPWQSSTWEHVSTPTNTLTATFHLDQEQIKLFRWDAFPWRIIGRFYLSTSYVQEWPSGEHLFCQTTTGNRDFNDYDGDKQNDLREMTRWQCQITDKGDKVLLEQAGPDIETVCLWDGHRLVLSSSQIVTPSTVLTGSLDAYPQLLGIEQDLLRLLDCSGDE